MGVSGRTDAVRTSDTDWDKNNRTVNRDLDRELGEREAKDTNPDAITGAPITTPVIPRQRVRARITFANNGNQAPSTGPASVAGVN